MQVTLLTSLVFAALATIVSADDTKAGIDVQPYRVEFAKLRIGLMLSPEFIGHFGSPKAQLQLRADLSDRLSIKNERFRKIVNLYTADASEQEAQHFLESFQAEYSSAVAEAELELRRYLDDSEFDEIVKLQIGISGPISLKDPLVIKHLGIADQKLAKVLKGIETLIPTEESARSSPAVRAAMESCLKDNLSADEYLRYTDACEAAKIYDDPEKRRQLSKAAGLEIPRITEK